MNTSKVRQMQMMIHLLLTSGTVMEVIYETIYTTQKILQLSEEETKQLCPVEFLLLQQSLEYRKMEELEYYGQKTM